MAWELNADRPVYTQILEIIQTRIISGIYAPGSRLPSVRELAAEASVNPNTMQRAFVELEKSGLVTTQRGSGSDRNGGHYNDRTGSKRNCSIAD